MTEVQIVAINEDHFDTVLAADIEFSGTMVVKKPLMIKGRVDGIITSESELMIDEGAQVTAEIKVGSLFIKGRLKGNIEASTRVDFYNTAVLDGNISTPQMTMETGCVFNGAVKMNKKNN